MNRLKNLIPVKNAFLHQPVTIPGVINGERTLNDVKAPGVKLGWCLHGLVATKDNRSALIPAANVAVMELK